MNIYKYDNKEEELAAACLEHVKQALEVSARLQKSADPAMDYELHLQTHPALRLAVDVKTRLATRGQAQNCIIRLRHHIGPRADAIVFTQWMPDLAADEFRRAGIFYADAQGNMFLRKPPRILIDVRGRRPERPIKAEPGRLIEPAGLKLIHHLLTDHEALQQPLRTLAEGANVALGTAYTVMRELERAQWVLPTANKGRKLGDRDGLIDLFVRGYALKLRPAYWIGRYRHRQQIPETILDGFKDRLSDHGKWAVTGAMAARELTHYLEPDTVTVFVDEEARTILEKEPLLRDQRQGNVVLLGLPAPDFLAQLPPVRWPLVTPLLTYAELLQEGGPRETETAGMVYERFIKAEASIGT